MKVTLISAVPPPDGGVATWTLKYIDYCKAHNIEVELVNIALCGKRGEQINSKRSYIDEIKRTYSVLSSMVAAVRNQDTEVVHINSSCSEFGIIRDLVCVAIARKKRLPIVFHCHCNIEDQVKNAFSLFFLQKAINLSTFVFVLNKNSQLFIKKICKTPNAIIPNFIEEKNVVSSHEIRDEIREIVFVGHVQKTKGCIEILQAAYQFSNIHFTLVGPVSDEIAKLTVPENVSMVGAVKLTDIKEYLSKADIYLFPSYTEGFSLSLTEAMANGLPCIASDVGANKDMLEESGGVIIKPHDVDEIVRAIKLLKEYKIRKLCSKWNIDKVRSCYLIDSIMNEIFEVYKEVQK